MQWLRKTPKWPNVITATWSFVKRLGDWEPSCYTCKVYTGTLSVLSAVQWKFLQVKILQKSMLHKLVWKIQKAWKLQNGLKEWKMLWWLVMVAGAVGASYTLDEIHRFPKDIAKLKYFIFTLLCSHFEIRYREEVREMFQHAYNRSFHQLGSAFRVLISNLDVFSQLPWARLPLRRAEASLVRRCWYVGQLQSHPHRCLLDNRGAII